MSRLLLVVVCDEQGNNFSFAFIKKLLSFSRGFMLLSRSTEIHVIAILPPSSLAASSQATTSACYTNSFLPRNNLSFYSFAQTIHLESTNLQTHDPAVPIPDSNHHETRFLSGTGSSPAVEVSDNKTCYGDGIASNLSFSIDTMLFYSTFAR